MERNKNALLQFPVLDVILTNDANGNPIPQPSATEQYECYVRDRSASITEDVQEFGADKEILFVTGFLVNPKSFSSGIGHLSEGVLTVTNPSGEVRTGAFTLKVAAQNPMAVNYIGYRFYGIWRVDLLPTDI